ncbi:MAG: RES family NAD+ phosphorylase [Actinomycetota bacterium]|nr:RES family NAD+ phosphorylase [Actinomycetota bacterium]
MAIWFRHGDARFPFLWESGPQAPGRWHDVAHAPATYLADSPDGAWAELLRHEEITDPADLRGISRRMWAVEVPDAVVEAAPRPTLATETLCGDLASYPACQRYATELRQAGATALHAPSAALAPAGGGGQKVDGGLVEAAGRDGATLVLFGGHWPDVRAWAAVDVGAPTLRQLQQVRHFQDGATLPASSSAS